MRPQKSSGISIANGGSRAAGVLLAVTHWVQEPGEGRDFSGSLLARGGAGWRPPWATHLPLHCASLWVLRLRRHLWPSSGIKTLGDGFSLSRAVAVLFLQQDGADTLVE